MKRTRELLSIPVIIFLIIPLFVPSLGNQLTGDEQELVLICGEIFFEIKAINNITSSFNVLYSVPPIYERQMPVMFDVCNDTNAKIITYRIENDTNHPNTIMNFTIAPMLKDENATVHLMCWVLVKTDDYSGLPNYVKKPLRLQLPEETKMWLESTNAIQSDHPRIKLVAWFLKGLSRNIIKIAQRISYFTSEIITAEGGTGGQDALSTLKRGNGVCTGKANLGVALFRVNNIPAKNIAVIPAFGKEAWTDMHYICQYYCPDYGWVFTETSVGITPFKQKNIIVMRVNYPEDENEAEKHGGVEIWFWTNNQNIIFPYNSTQPMRRAWIERSIFKDKNTAEISFNITKGVYQLHIKYLGMNLSEANQQCFSNAISAQKNAIDCFTNSDILGYLNDMNIAYTEYMKIE